VEGIIALIMIFGMPVFIVGIREWSKLRRLKIEKEGALDEKAQKRLASLESERALLEGRVQNLETIVTSVDLELNARLNRLAAQPGLLALPPHVPTPPSPAPALASPALPALAAPTPGEDLVTAHTLAVKRASSTLRAIGGELAVGSLLLDRFRVERLLGRGGMGAVYLATDQKIGEQVALKVLSANLVEDPAATERFRREVGAARKISHPNVIRIHDLGDDGGLLFISMEHFQGKTLSEILQVRKRLPVAEGRALLLQICDALAAAHGVGVVHRDLKPQNVLINERGEAKVIDFGIAKASYAGTLTATGMIMGTPEYMSPEQIRGRPVDARADLYSFGAVAYHLFCGRPPFVADTPIAVGYLHTYEAPGAPRQLAPELPETLEAAILKCLAKEPSQRFDSALDLRTRLLA
jgi:eukaryotic-like serine/threonine-protein kinase